ncbi:actin family [Dipodascopsis tothii]|uniref:actin family n=1 Tax=Dipodascopsis tothii TaxID=44089 RepID=UPI0034CFD065
MTSRTFILDNGAHTIKAGYAGSEAPAVIPNCIARSKTRGVFVADEINSRLKDQSGVDFRRPIDKGHLVNWESEKAIWDRVFFAEELGFRIPTDDTTLVLTEPVLSLPACSANTDQIVFEEYGFGAYVRCPAATLASFGPAFGAPGECTLVIDMGYNAVNIVPVVDHAVVTAAVRRLNVGGKLLTNYLKETISYRYYNMMDETAIVAAIKEACCYVTADYAADLERWRAGGDVVAEYVLPTATAGGFRPGHVRGPGERVGDDEQVLKLGNERFAVPELLFAPSDAGLRQGGLHEGVAQALAAIDDETTRALLAANIVVVGGTALLPGVRERLTRELRPLLPAEYTIRLGAVDRYVSLPPH